MFDKVWGALEKTGYPWIVLSTIIFLIILVILAVTASRSRSRNQIIITNMTQEVQPETSYGRIVKVIDGDTIRVIDNDYSYSHVRKIKKPEDYKQFKKGSFSVRLYGIDTPERAFAGNTGQKYGDLAHDVLKKFCFDEDLSERVSNLIDDEAPIYKECRLLTLDIDSYGRSLCVVTVGGTDLSQYMLDQGLACVYYGRGAKYNGQLKKFERKMKKAMEEKIGMWQEDIELPAEYKRRMRKRG